MVFRTLSAALIVLLLATPLAAAWCEACLQDRCDMFGNAPDVLNDAPATVAMPGARADEPSMAAHHGHGPTSSAQSSAPSSHCAEMATASSEVDPAAAANVPFQGTAECCQEDTSDADLLALAPTAPQLLQMDVLATATGQPHSAGPMTNRAPTGVEWTPRPPPRPLFTLHSLLLI